MLCRWSIHYPTQRYEWLKSRTPSPEPNPDPANEESWKPWSLSQSQLSCEERLLDSLETNNFATTKAENLPIAIHPILQAVENSEEKLLEEAFGFAIMARNLELIVDLHERNDGKDLSHLTRQLNPLHLAITYLDGSKACCGILNEILLGPMPATPSSLNNLGHTALDNLMIVILKAHTSIDPGFVDNALRDEERFPGEEVDICGRWDADSHCYRKLLASGTSRITFAWKHKFCHTSVQAVSHCIRSLAFYSEAYESCNIFETTSGIFSKLCVFCGQKLQLHPLHSLILTAFGLAEYGHEDEDLFGVVAILMTMLSKGADPSRAADISVASLFPEHSESQDQTGCSHEFLRPAELARQISRQYIGSWSDQKHIGWQLMCAILSCSEQEWDMREETPMHDCSRYLSHSIASDENFFGDNRNLADLHAAIQAELLTYRRLAEGDPWTSPNFDMSAALRTLTSSDPISMGLLDNDMLKPICKCGFLEPYDLNFRERWKS